MMTRLASLFVLSACVPLAVAGDCRTLDESFEGAGLERLSVEVRVGQLEVRPSDDGRVHLELEVCPDDGWFASRKGREPELRVEQDAGRLHLEVVDEDFEERWVIRMPAAAALEADMGIGQVTLEGLSGDVTLDLGIGQVEFEGRAQDYGSAGGDVGIGEFTIQAPGDSAHEERVLVTESAEWRGEGKGRIAVDVGIGEVDVRLQ